MMERIITTLIPSLETQTISACSRGKAMVPMRKIFGGSAIQEKHTRTFTRYENYERGKTKGTSIFLLEGLYIYSRTTTLLWVLFFLMVGEPPHCLLGLHCISDTPLEIDIWHLS